MKGKHELLSLYKELPSGKKIYFASDFHLGVPSERESLVREQKITRWLQHVSNNAAAIFLVGDIFDFWFEYKSTVPKHHIRFLGKIAELVDRGIPVHFFTGNHDLWMFDYFPNSLGIPVHHGTITLEVESKLLFVGHGDGLGPGDRKYKLFKKIFTNPLCQRLFHWIHPNIGVGLAKYWSRRSRKKSLEKEDLNKGANEPLLIYSQEVEKEKHHDFYVFGHRHMELQMPVAEHATYFNLGDWVTGSSYLEFDGNNAVLKTFDH